MDRNSSVPCAHMGCQVNFLHSQTPFKFSHVLSSFVSKIKNGELSSLSARYLCTSRLRIAVGSGPSLPWAVASLGSDVTVTNMSKG